MKKSVTFSLISSLSVLLFIGCSASNSSILKSHDAKTANSTFYKTHLTQKKAHKLIVNAGKKVSWKMTEFKYNAIIAEKMINDEMISVTILFDNSSFEIHPANDELKDAIVDELNINYSNH